MYTKRQSSFVHNCFVILYRVFIANIRGRGHVSQNFTSPSSMQILPWWRLLILKKMCHDRLFSWSHCIVSNIKTLQKACHIFIIASLKTSLITEKLAKVNFSICLRRRPFTDVSFHPKSYFCCKFHNIFVKWILNMVEHEPYIFCQSKYKNRFEIFANLGNRPDSLQFWW